MCDCAFPQWHRNARIHITKGSVANSPTDPTFALAHVARVLGCRHLRSACRRTRKVFRLDRAHSTLYYAHRTRRGRNPTYDSMQLEPPGDHSHHFTSAVGSAKRVNICFCVCGERKDNARSCHDPCRHDTREPSDLFWPWGA